jgi:phage shock protein E
VHLIKDSIGTTLGDLGHFRFKRRKLPSHSLREAAIKKHQMKQLTLSAMLAFGLASCSQGQQNLESRVGEHHVVSAQEFANRPVESVLVDVRTPGEWRGGIIEGALLFDISSAEFETNMSALEKETPVYIYCAAGGRSGTASEMMKKKGYTVYDLKGGMGAWTASGRPTVNP